MRKNHFERNILVAKTLEMLARKKFSGKDPVSKTEKLQSEISELTEKFNNTAEDIDLSNPDIEFSEAPEKMTDLLLAIENKKDEIKRLIESN